MVNPRSWVAPDGTRGTFHVISRCTRRQWLMHGQYAHRKAWVCALLAELLDVFQVDLHAWTVMANHVHLVLRPRPDRVEAMDAERLTRLGMRAMPVRTGVANEVLPVTDDVVARYSRNSPWVEEYRKRLGSISWLMKLFKQRISYRANTEDGCKGHFWESRFLSVPLLEMGAVVACMAYVDANPFRAGVADLPEEAAWTSLWARSQADALAGHAEATDTDPWENPHWTGSDRSIPSAVRCRPAAWTWMPTEIWSTTPAACNNGRPWPNRFAPWASMPMPGRQ